MKKRSILNLFLIGIILISPIGVNAKTIKNEVFNYGGNDYDWFYSITDTSDGGYVAVGLTYSTDINGITNHGEGDAIVVKYDKNNKIVWKKTYGGSEDDWFYGVDETADGGYIVVGESASTDIEGITNKGAYDAIIVKYDKDGNLEWQKNYGGSAYDYFEKVKQTSDGGYVAVGNILSTNIEGIINNGGYDTVIVKYDENGNIEWQNTTGGKSHDYFYGVTLTQDGGYVAVGESESTDIEEITNKGSDDAIIVKYDKDGNIKWQKSYGGSSNDYFKGVTLTSDGGYIAVGYTKSKDIEGITNKGNYDAIMVKYDKDGNIEWQKNYGGSDSDCFYGITLTSDGGYITTGYIASTDIEDITNKGKYDAVLVKYDKNGNLEWQQNYGGNDDDWLNAVVLTSNGIYVAVGCTYSTDISGMSYHGEGDALVVTLSYEYDIIEEKTSNGSFETIREGNLGKISVNPSAGYELDTIVIADTAGNLISYYEKDGYYYFDLTDDVTVSVKYKAIANPSTGLSNPYIVLISLMIISIVTGLILKKKKYI